MEHNRQKISTGVEREKKRLEEVKIGAALENSRHIGKKTPLEVPRTQNKSGKLDAPLNTLPRRFFLNSIKQIRPHVATILQCSYHELTELATQWHGGITSACHCIAKSRACGSPRRKTAHACHNQLALTIRFLLPSGKFPLAQQVSRPPAHPTTHPSPLTLPMHCQLQ